MLRVEEDFTFLDVFLVPRQFSAHVMQEQMLNYNQNKQSPSWVQNLVLFVFFTLYSHGPWHRIWILSKMQSVAPSRVSQNDMDMPQQPQKQDKVCRMPVQLQICMQYKVQAWYKNMQCCAVRTLVKKFSA